MRSAWNAFAWRGCMKHNEKNFQLYRKEELFMELKGTKINFLGDSITEGAGTSCVEARFTTLMKEIAGVAEIRNYGIGGTRIARQQTVNNEQYDKNDYCARFSAMDDDADIIVVFGGTNDYGHGDAPFGTFSDRTPETFCGAVHYLFRGLIEKYPTKPIVVITPLHRENDTVPNALHGKTLKDYVDVIREGAEMYSLPVLDLFASFGVCPDIPAQKAAYCPDGLHPNDAGNRKIAEKLKTFLEAL